MPAHLADPDHNPSFTKGLFCGEIREDLVFPFPELSKDEHDNLAAVLDSFRAWAAENVNSAKMDHDGKFTDAVRAGMAELGLMGLNIPEEWGGFGASAMMFNRVYGETKDKVTAFIVDAHAPGVSLGKLEEKMGIKASDTRAVSFENVKVPKEDLLGEAGHGFRIALEILNSGRLGLAAASTRGAR